MTLSIIIVSFNTKEILEKCLASLKDGCQGLKGKREVIIVDNASTDGSKQMLKKLRLETIFNRQNRGFAQAVNQGIKKSQSKYILLLNSDIICQKGSITKLIRFAQDRSNLGVAAGRLLNPDLTPQASASYLPTLKGAIREFWLGQKGAFLKYFPRAKKASAVEAVVGAVMLIPRKVIIKIGALNEKYFMYFEDFDFCRRLKKAGLKVYYLPSARFIHYHGASGKTISGKTQEWLVQSSQQYHGLLKYYLLTLIIWLGQRWQKKKS